MEIEYRMLDSGELRFPLFASFIRTQQVTRCWRKENGEWTLRDIAFTENWGNTEKEQLALHLRHTALTGGGVFGALVAGTLVGFCSLEAARFGSRLQYAQLSSLHVSAPWRGQGIGRRLFGMAAGLARERKVQKLYISAHSAEETQAFYSRLGCIDAEEINLTLAEAEPCDRQLEYQL